MAKKTELIAAADTHLGMPGSFARIAVFGIVRALADSANGGNEPHYPMLQSARMAAM